MSAPAPKKELSLLDATMLVAGSMIGSGIFIVSADVARYVGGAGWVLLVWLLVGIMTIIGALSYGELAGMMPKVGGQFIYLKEAYNPLVAFLFGWSEFLVIQTGTIAAVAVGFGRFTGVLFPYFDESNILFEAGRFRVSGAQLLAVGSIITLTVINLRGIREAKLVQLILTITKVAALAGLIVLGISVGLRSDTFAQNWATAWDFFKTDKLSGQSTVLGGLTLLMALGTAMIGPLFSSSAWNNITYAAAEIKNPKRDIPLSLLYGALLVSGLYLLANISYQMVLPVSGTPQTTDVLKRGIMFASNDRVGTAAAEVMLGGIGTAVMAVFIMISTFGCNNGLILAGARVYYAMAQEGLFFQKARQLSARGVPAASLILQSTWACLLCLSGTYSDLLNYTVFTVLIFYILTITGVFVLRRKQPQAPRPYRAWGYPLLPALYVLMATAICVNLLFAKPSTSLAGLGLVALGVPVYYYWRSRGATKV
jgi:basic amino acid/polyamine antiporter, APA family